jgi:membrane-bound lytic murein transglycosylase D
VWAQGETDFLDDEGENIEIPEGMFQDIDSMLHEWRTRNILNTDEECAYSSTAPEFTDDIYIQRLSALPTVMEMPFNPIVRRFIEQYNHRLRYSVPYLLGAISYYEPFFEEALETYGCPLELKYLPIIESALNPNATSSAGAAGLWQLIVTTGRRYNLEVNSLIDERRDPIKSSYAAARYLRDLYKIFQDWTLVIAAYNCGPGNVIKAIHRANEDRDYWNIYPYLPRETQGYVPAFIAANYIMNYYSEHNICPMKPRIPVSTDTVKVSQDIDLRQISEMCDVSLEALKTLNPQYRTTLVPGTYKESTIRIPQTAIGSFITWGDSIYRYRADEWITKRSVVTVNETVLANNNSKSSGGRHKGKSSGRQGHSKNVVVRKGDTLSSIAKRNGTTVSQLKRINGLRSDNIQQGKSIRIK